MSKLEKTAEFHVFLRLMQYMLQYKWLTFGALSCLFMMSVVESAIPLVARHYIDTFIQQQETPSSNLAILAGYYSLFVIQMLFVYCGNLLFAKVSFRVVEDIRHDAFYNLQKLSMRYFDRTPSGSIVSRLTNDTQAVSTMFSDILSTFLRAIFIFSATLYTMLTLEWYVTALLVACLPFIFVLVYLYRKQSTPIISKTRQLLSELNVKLSESIQGMRVIQSFGQEQRLYDEFETINQEHLHYANRSVKVDSLFLRPAMSLLKLLAYALLMLYFGLAWQNMGISAGLIYAFIQYVNRLFDPLIQLTQNYSQLQTSIIAAGRVFLLIDNRDYEPLQRDTDAKITKGKIEFKHVTFSYDGITPVLQDISFQVNQGETIAFVGHTGSGKSSIINLFMRFYEFEHGQILIDDVDIKDYTKNELAKHIGLVLQEPFLFHGTIESNITMGNRDVTVNDMENASRFVGAHEFIQHLPNGYQESVTERGSTFSSGQRQLIAFARTMARQPKILILDEATASIDSATEEVIQQSLKKMRQGRTTIAIAHRLSTIQDANCIYVLDKGRIVESGTHDTLIAKRGTYYNMFQLQVGALE